MVVPGLSPVLRRAVHFAQSFSRCRVTRDIWRSDQCRAFNRKPEVFDSDIVKKPRPKTEPVPKITLVSLDNSVSVTVLEEAQRLAKRRNLTLVKVNDLENKTQRPLYKLVNSTDDILEDTEEKEDTKSAEKSSKGTKLLYVSAKITEHDLQTKTKNVVRLLKKGHKVKIVITLDGSDGDKMQTVIEDAVKNDGSVQRMPSKKSVILFLISPLHKNEKNSVDNKNEIGSTSS
ncbi:translation initiation factor IF-3 [Solenopsis invicta]|uniref:translation initiation factor IF-3 n=1 Tax=Solenopsis invicta TaxID=13686 RepID=UPI000595CF38|nr:translation initiation factor IF-3 [Solenopsis invicta]